MQTTRAARRTEARGEGATGGMHTAAPQSSRPRSARATLGARARGMLRECRKARRRAARTGKARTQHFTYARQLSNAFSASVPLSRHDSLVMTAVVQPCCVAPRCRARARVLRSRTCCVVAARQSYGNDERNDAASTPPLVLPSLDLTPRQAVTAQLDALAQNNTPRPDHGMEVAYRFALGTGGFGLSSYFGHSADLYHFGHFCLKFRTLRAALVDHRGYEVLREGAASAAAAQGAHEVDVAVQPRDGAASRWRFTLLRRDMGRTAGCWLTDAVMPLD